MNARQDNTMLAPDAKPDVVSLLSVKHDAQADTQGEIAKPEAQVAAAAERN